MQCVIKCIVELLFWNISSLQKNNLSCRKILYWRGQLRLNTFSVSSLQKCETYIVGCWGSNTGLFPVGPTKAKARGSFLLLWNEVKGQITVHFYFTKL